MSGAITSVDHLRYAPLSTVDIVGMNWSPTTIIEKDKTERLATALEETWIERFKKRHKRDKSTKFKKSAESCANIEAYSSILIDGDRCSSAGVSQDR